MSNIDKTSSNLQHNAFPVDMQDNTIEDMNNLDSSPNKTQNNTDATNQELDDQINSLWAKTIANDKIVSTEEETPQDSSEDLQQPNQPEQDQFPTKEIKIKSLIPKESVSLPEPAINDGFSMSEIQDELKNTTYQKGALEGFQEVVNPTKQEELKGLAQETYQARQLCELSALDIDGYPTYRPVDIKGWIQASEKEILQIDTFKKAKNALGNISIFLKIPLLTKASNLYIQEYPNESTSSKFITLNTELSSFAKKRTNDDEVIFKAAVDTLTNLVINAPTPEKVPETIEQVTSNKPEPQISSLDKPLTTPLQNNEQSVHVVESLGEPEQTAPKIESLLPVQTILPAQTPPAIESLPMVVQDSEQSTQVVEHLEEPAQVPPTIESLSQVQNIPPVQKSPTVESLHITQNILTEDTPKIKKADIVVEPTVVGQKSLTAKQEILKKNYNSFLKSTNPTEKEQTPTQEIPTETIKPQEETLTQPILATEVEEVAKNSIEIMEQKHAKPALTEAEMFQTLKEEKDWEDGDKDESFYAPAKQVLATNKEIVPDPKTEGEILTQDISTEEKVHISTQETPTEAIKPKQQEEVPTEGEEVNKNSTEITEQEHAKPALTEAEMFQTLKEEKDLEDGDKDESFYAPEKQVLTTTKEIVPDPKIAKEILTQDTGTQKDIDNEILTPDIATPEDIEAEFSTISKPNKELSNTKTETETKENLETSPRVYADYLEKLNITKEELQNWENFEIFISLSEGQQLALLENLTVLTLDRVKDEALLSHDREDEERREEISKIKEEQKNTNKKNPNFFRDKMQRLNSNLGQMWRGFVTVVNRNRDISIKEKVGAEKLLDGGLAVHEEVLNELTFGMADSGPEIELVNNDLEISFVKTKENQSENENNTIQEFNFAASELALVPKEWAFETATKKQKEAAKTTQTTYQSTYDKLFKLINERNESSGKGAQETYAEIAEIEKNVEMQRFFNNNQDAIAELHKIKDPSFFSDIWSKSRMSGLLTRERGMYVGLGMIGRGALAATGLSILAGPAVAAGVGGYRGALETNKALRKSDIQARKGIEDKSKESKNYIQLSGKENALDKIYDLIDSINNYDAYEEKIKLRYNTLSHTENKDLPEMSHGKRLHNLKTEEQLQKSLKTRIDFIQTKITLGRVNYGETKAEQVRNYYDLLKALSEAKATYYTQVNRPTTLTTKLDHYLEHLETGINKERTLKKKKRINQGIKLGAKYGILGSILVHSPELAEDIGIISMPHITNTTDTPNIIANTEEIETEIEPSTQEKSTIPITNAESPELISIDGMSFSETSDHFGIKSETDLQELKEFITILGRNVTPEEWSLYNFSKLSNFPSHNDLMEFLKNDPDGLSNGQFKILSNQIHAYNAELNNGQHVTNVTEPDTKTTISTVQPVIESDIEGEIPQTEDIKNFHKKPLLDESTPDISTLESIPTIKSVPVIYKILESENIWDIAEKEISKHPQWATLSDKQQHEVMGFYKDTLTDTRQYTPDQINTQLKSIFFNRNDNQPIDPFVVYSGEEIDLTSIIGNKAKLDSIIEKYTTETVTQTQQPETTAPLTKPQQTPQNIDIKPKTDKGTVDSLLSNAFKNDNIDPTVSSDNTQTEQPHTQTPTEDIETTTSTADILHLEVNLKGLKPETLHEATELRAQIFENLKNQPLTTVEEFSSLSNTNTRAIAKIFGENELDHLSESPYPINHMQRARLYLLSGINENNPALANNQTIQYMHNIYQKQLEDGHEQLIIESAQNQEIATNPTSIELGAMSPELEIKLKNEAHSIWRTYLKDHNFAITAMSKLSSGTNLEMGAINKALTHMNSIADTVGNNDGKVEQIDVLSTSIFMINHVPEDIKNEIESTQLYANLRNESFQTHLNRPTYST